MSIPNFYEMAARLGHSADALKAGETVTSTITVNNLDELKNLLSDIIPADCKPDILRNMLASSTSAENDNTTSPTLLQKLHAHVYADMPLSVADQSAIAAAFPLELKSISALSLTCPPGETCWGKSQTVIANFNQMIMEDGAYITAYNSSISSIIYELTRNGAPPAGHSDFNILGITGTVGSAGAVGPTGATGNKGADGTEGQSAPVNGSIAGNGGNGLAGSNGGNGIPSMDADFIIVNLKGTTTLSFLNASGAGGAGGAGGQGGAGGVGGAGGNLLPNLTCLASPVVDTVGNGGNGGNGGTGGKGGNGGNGADAGGMVVVCLPPQYLAGLKYSAIPAPGGAAGAGGVPGQGGYGGMGGIFTNSKGGYHNSIVGHMGISGQSGSAGTPGTAGAASAKPAQFVPMALTTPIQPPVNGV